MFRATLLLAACFSVVLRAEVRFHPLFQDGAVLQQGRALVLWGTADAGAPVRVACGDHVAETRADERGRWSVELPALPASGPFVLRASGPGEAVSNVLVGEVWLAAGHGNMEQSLEETVDASALPRVDPVHPVRILRLGRKAAPEPTEDVPVASGWTSLEPATAGVLPAVPAHFAAHLARARGVAVGIVVATWPGTPAEAWTPVEALASVPELVYHAALADQRRRVYQEQRDVLEAAYAAALDRALALRSEGREVFLPEDPNPDHNPSEPGHVWKRMVVPLARLPLRGILWYEDEMNIARAYEYRTLLPTLIRAWRSALGHELPFLIVQAAPSQAIVSDPRPSARAEFREAQDLTVRTVPRTGTALTVDLGNEHDHRSRRKALIGERLALLARRIAYGEDVVATPPALAEASVRGGTVILRFDRPVTTRGEVPSGFALAGRDGIFHAAQARQIDATTFHATSPEVFAPLWVRYGWADHPLGNLAGTEWLPVAPFRTDSLPGITWPREPLAPRMEEIVLPGI